MKKKYSSRRSESDLNFLHNAQDEDIDLSDIPEVTEDQLRDAKIKYKGQPIPSGKVRVNMYLDADIVAFFKAKAGGRGYQTLINETLRQSIAGENLETLLRRVIREETAGYTVDPSEENQP